MSFPLLALFLAAFSFGTAEFVIAGVLPDVAAGLGVTIPIAGYLISLYAIGIAIGGPVLAVLTKKMNRKKLIIMLGALFTLGQVLSALAPNFEFLLAARLVVSFMHGTFFGIAAIVAVSIVAPDRRGFAVALILSGLTVSNVLGVPGGTAIGNMLGWRATFWAVGALGLIATMAIARFLPADAGASASIGSVRKEFKALARQPILTSLVIGVLSMIGQYSLFTYITPLLTEVTGLDATVVPWLLLLYGIGSTGGVFLGGRLADWKLMPALIGFLGLQIFLFLGLYLAAPYGWTMAVLVVLWGFANFGFGSPLQSRILAAASDAPNLASALIPTCFNIGIAAGAILGSTLLDAGFGYQNLPLIGLVTLTLATLTAIASAMLDKRAARGPALAAALTE